MKKNALALPTILAALAFQVGAVNCGHADLPSDEDRFFVYEKDGDCQLEIQAPKHWLAVNGAGWVLDSVVTRI